MSKNLQKFVRTGLDVLAKRMQKYIPVSGDTYDMLAGRMVYEYTTKYTDGDIARLASYCKSDVTHDELMGLYAFDYAMNLCDMHKLTDAQDRDSARVEVCVSLMHKRATRVYDKRSRKWVRKVAMAEYACIPFKSLKYGRVFVAPFANPNTGHEQKPMPWASPIDGDTLTLQAFFKFVSRVYRNAHFPYVVAGNNAQWQAKLVVRRKVD